MTDDTRAAAERFLQRLVDWHTLPSREFVVRWPGTNDDMDARYPSALHDLAKGRLTVRLEPARCERCHWPLASTMEEGCVPGNCSMREAR